MTTTAEDAISNTDMVEIQPQTGLAVKAETPAEEIDYSSDHTKIANGETEKENANGNAEKTDATKKEVPVETEPKTGLTFPVELEDGKKLNAVGLRKKGILGMGIKIYGFGIYADNAKLKELMTSKIGKAPTKPTNEMYKLVIDSDADMLVRLVIVFSSLTMSMVKKNFDEGLGASIKKLSGAKNEELTQKFMGEASDSIKLTSGSVIEISRMQGHALQAKVKGEIVSTVESELLCRAYISMYLGDDPLDKEAKEKFGMALLSLF